MAVIVAACAFGFLTAPAIARPTANNPLAQNAPSVPATTSTPGFALPETLVWAKIALLCLAPLILIALWMRDVIRPGSFDRRRPKRDLEGLPASAWLGCAGILYISPMLGATLVAGTFKIVPGTSLSMREQGILALAAYSIGIATCLLLAYLIKPRAPAAGLRLEWKDLFKGLAAFLLALPVLELVSILGVWGYKTITGESPEVLSHQTLRDIVEQPRSPWVWAIIFGAGVGAPVVEECVFRLFLQSGLARATRSHWAAILITSAAFALVHRLSDSPVPWHSLPILFVLGLAMGIALERTGRVLVPIVMHMAFNCMSLAIVMLSS